MIRKPVLASMSRRVYVDTEISGIGSIPTGQESDCEVGRSLKESKAIERTTLLCPTHWARVGWVSGLASTIMEWWCEVSF